MKRIGANILRLTAVTDNEEKARVAQLGSLATELISLMKEHETSTRIIKLVTRLYCPEMHRRFDPAQETDSQLSNEWIYEPDITGFVSWLEGTSRNDNVFYIYGKVRVLSDKSTTLG